MRLEHIAVYVSDLEGARAFFEKYFGGVSNSLYHNVATGFRSYFLSFDGGARLELMTKPALPERDPAERPGYVHIAVSVGSREAVDSLSAALMADGYSVISGPRTTGDGYYECAVLGFEDLLIEVTV